MLLACLALGLISCRDTIDPREERSSSQVQEQEASGPVTVLRLTCTLSFSNGEQGEVRCGEPGAGAPGVSRSVILPVSSEYARWLPYYLVKDTVTETWSFLSVVENLLGQPIGTLDGTTAVGTKVAVTYGPVASAGTGTVSLINADGTGTFTAPNQPYFDYPGITAPGAYSTYRTWQVHVPNTVTEVTMGVAISTDFPAEQDVAIAPPDSAPAWLSADSSSADPTSHIGHEFTKNAAIVIFSDNSNLADRQLAIALVGGKVIGGRRALRGSGAYYLWLPDDGSGAEIRAATNKLKALPQVMLAMPMTRLAPMYLRPNDEGDWRSSKWRLDPANANLGDERWALEEVEAPMAWGCTVGDAATTVGILDHGFHRQNIPDLQALPALSYATDPADTGQHGTHVASVIAAEGNNGSKMAGIMWHAAFEIEDPNLSISDATGQFHKLTPDSFYFGLQRLIKRGVPVINLSWGIPYYEIVNGQKVWRQPGTSAFPNDSTDALDWAGFLNYWLKRDFTGPLPLIVIGAGNFPYAGANGTVNSWWSGLPILRDSFPDNVIVVGASTKNRSVANFSGNNVAEPNRAPHHYVEIMAPGDSVFVLDRNNNVVSKSGTSLSAPMVTGMAGLLLSFDPRLATSPAELKRLILAGADSSWDAAGANDPARHVVGNGGPYRLLNAYEPLKLAARRPDAPLCGNRVWTADNAVYTERESGSATQLINVGQRAGFVNVLHGGKRLHVFRMDTFDNREFDYLNGQWTDVGSPGGQPTPIWSGATNSLRHLNHDGDSVVYLQPGSGIDSARFTVMLRDTSAGSTPRALANVSVPLQQWTDEVCVREEAELNWVDDDLYIGPYSCRETASLGTNTTASAYATFSPLSDRIIVTVSTQTASSTGIGPWSTCPWAMTGNGGVSSRCRSVTYQESSSDAQVFSIRTSDGQRQALPGIPSSYVFWQAVGEPGKEMAVTAGDVQSVYAYGPNDATSYFDGGFRTEGMQSSVVNCRVDFKDLASGAVRRSVPLGDRCGEAGWDGIGTMSPMVASRGGAVKASAPQP